MRVLLELDIEVDADMRLSELDGLCAVLEHRRDVVSAYVRRARVLTLRRPREEAGRE